MSESLKEESQRQCPACRNWVSHLATRCHYCGETLGRPRKEEVRKTIKDLGGESHSQYSVSGNVMDALEAFREENLSEAEGIRRQKEEMAQTWFGRKHASDAPAGASKEHLPELHGDHKSLADDILGEAPAVRTPAPRARRNDSDLIRNIGIGVGVLGILVAFYFFVLPAIQSIIAERNKPVIPEHTNNTRAMMDAGAAPVGVLQEAHAAVDVAPTEENLAQQEAARAYVVNAVQALLNSDTFDDGKLGSASEIMNLAARIDTSPAIKQLSEEVSKEVTQHKFILVSVTPDSTKATFKLNDAAAGDQAEVSVGEMLLDRFIVTAITSTSVRLEDTKRQVHGRQRPLVSRPFQAVSGS